MDIKEIKRLSESGMSGMGLIDRQYLFPWVTLTEVEGIDSEKLREANLEAQEVGVGPSDDSILLDYIRSSFWQHSELAKAGHVEAIPPDVYLRTLLEISVELEADEIDVLDVPRADLDRKMLMKCLLLFDEYQGKARTEFRKERILDWMKYFFCVEYLSPELNNLPIVSSFIETKEFQAKLEIMESRIT